MQVIADRIIDRRMGRNFYTCPGVVSTIDHLPETLTGCIARLFEANESGIISKCRERELSDGRHLLRYVLYNDCGWSFREVSLLTGCYDTHQPFYNSMTRAKCLIETDYKFRNNYGYVKHKLDFNKIILPDKP
jgi:hypothetical protein